MSLPNSFDLKSYLAVMRFLVPAFNFLFYFLKQLIISFHLIAFSFANGPLKTCVLLLDTDTLFELVKFLTNWGRATTSNVLFWTSLFSRALIELSINSLNLSWSNVFTTLQFHSLCWSLLYSINRKNWDK